MCVWYSIGFATFTALSMAVFIIATDYNQALNTRDLAHNYSSSFTIRIPSLNITGEVESVGINSKKEIATPKDPAHAGWFNQGPYPGEKGVAIINGHYGWKDNIPALFDSLSAIKIDDTVQIISPSHSTRTFIVRGKRTYNENSPTESIFISSDGKAHLNLITCAGEWDEIKNSYSERLVVFTDLIE